MKLIWRFILNCIRPRFLCNWGFILIWNTFIIFTITTTIIYLLSAIIILLPIKVHVPLQPLQTRLFDIRFVKVFQNVVKLLRLWYSMINRCWCSTTFVKCFVGVFKSWALLLLCVTSFIHKHSLNCLLIWPFRIFKLCRWVVCCF